MIADSDGLETTFEDLVTKRRCTVIDEVGEATVSTVHHINKIVIQIMKDAAESSLYSYTCNVSN